MKSSVAALLSFIRSHDDFIILGHQEPDSDCITSQLVLGRLLQFLGRSYRLANVGPFRRSEIRNYAPLFVLSPQDLGDFVPQAALVVDSSTRERVGAFFDLIAQLPTAVIDHHSSGDIDGQVVWVDETRASTSLLILELAQAAAYKLSQEEAALLFLGFSTDTGFFRHLSSQQADSLVGAAELLRLGADPRETFLSLQSGKPYSVLAYWALLLERVETFWDNWLLLSSHHQKDQEKFGIVSSESELLFPLFQSVEGNEVIALLREESPMATNVSLRSRLHLDVGSVAQSLGGGGHYYAAGFRFEGNIEETKKALRQVLEDEYKKIQRKLQKNSSADGGT